MASRRNGGGGLAQPAALGMHGRPAPTRAVLLLLGLTLALAAVQPVTAGCEVIFRHAVGPPFYVQEFSIRYRSIESEAACMKIHN